MLIILEYWFRCSSTCSINETLCFFHVPTLLCWVECITIAKEWHYRHLLYGLILKKKHWLAWIFVIYYQWKCFNKKNKCNDCGGSNIKCFIIGEWMDAHIDEVNHNILNSWTSLYVCFLGFFAISRGTQQLRKSCAVAHLFLVETFPPLSDGFLPSWLMLHPGIFTVCSFSKYLLNLCHIDHNGKIEKVLLFHSSV